MEELHDIHESLQKIISEINNLKYGEYDKPPTFGERMADKVVTFIGSWKFIVMQSIILVIWIAFNSYSLLVRFDPYPFILLNLALSFQAAFSSPLILMAQNRSDQKDRRKAIDAYRSIEQMEKMMMFVVERLKIIKNGNGNGNSEKGNHPTNGKF